MLSPNWLKVGSTQPCGLCLHKHLTNAIQGHSLEILGVDLTSVHCPGQNKACFKFDSKIVVMVSFIFWRPSWDISNT